jgi:hypothetical protein
MKKEKNLNEIIEAAGIAVISVLFLNVIFTTFDGDAIWSLSGFGVMFGIAFIQIAFQALYKRINPLKHLTSLIVVLAMVYVVGILLASVCAKMLGYDAVCTPIGGATGVIMSYWVAFVAWVSSKLLLK